MQQMMLCKISSQPSTSSQPLVISHTVTVNDDCTWSVLVHGHSVAKSCKALAFLPDKINFDCLQQLLSTLDKCWLCPGNPDKHFMKMARSRKNKFVSVTGETNAIVETGEVRVGEELFHETIRHINCEIICDDPKPRCAKCALYRPNLRVMYSRYQAKANTEPSKFSNERYLNTPQKIKKIKSLKSKVHAAKVEIHKLQERIAKLTESEGVNVGRDFHKDMYSIMESNNEAIAKQYPEGSFRRLFWEEQFKAAKHSSLKQMRWHPLIIHWCLNLKYLSSSCYHSLGTSGFIKLPSERTLRDYTHFIKSKPGFQDEVDHMLADEAKLSSTT